jgi:L-lactate permease
VSEEFGMLEGYGVLEVLRELAANCRGRWRNLMLLVQWCFRNFVETQRSFYGIHGIRDNVQ